MPAFLVNGRDFEFWEKIAHVDHMKIAIFVCDHADIMNQSNSKV